MPLPLMEPNPNMVTPSMKVTEPDAPTGVTCADNDTLLPYTAGDGVTALSTVVVEVCALRTMDQSKMPNAA